MIHFEEKPLHPKSTLSSTGVYLYSQSTLLRLKSYLAQGGKKDKAGDFLAWLHTKEEVYGYVTSEPWYDIGSLEQLETARQEFRK
jgi:glucose-1-phosphate thymidylyltransferase